MKDDMTGSGGLVEYLSRNRVTAAIIGVLAFALLTGALGMWQSPVSARGRGGSLPPAASVENFARGQATFDAQLMWNSLSDEMIQNLQFQGVDISQVQSQLDDQRNRGLHYLQETYVGGHKAPTGESFYLYVFVRQSEMTGDSAESVPYVFMVDGSGKIAGIQ